MRFLEIDSNMTALTSLMTFQQLPGRKEEEGVAEQGRAGLVSQWGRGTSPNIIADKWQYFMGFYFGHQSK